MWRAPYAFTDMYGGMVTMGLHQSAAATYMRLGHAAKYSDPCEHPPLWEATSTNAYYLHPFGCVLIFPGLVRRPFADEFYDDESLRFRIGAIIAHELAHATDYVPTYSDRVARLMHHYNSNTWKEARADLIAALAVLKGDRWNTSRSVQRFAIHWGQMWCGVEHHNKDDRINHPQATAEHPHLNVRADALCTTLRDLSIPCEFNIPLQM